MKKILSIVLSAIVSSASAQWSDTNNNFEDSLHMPVSTALQAQQNPIVLTSYPDGGYFVIWEDIRNNAVTKKDIYAQKYDQAGNRLWAVNGVPVSNGPNDQHFTFSSSQDYRNRSFAATDSAGGFYMCYSDDSLGNYVWERVMVQHVRNNGTSVFPAPGVIIARSGAANLQMASQLIPDGNKGFFIAYAQKSGNDYIHVYCYRDENGTLKFYGGGRVNENAIQTTYVAPCGIKSDIVYPGTSVSDYNIWSDQDGGCNVVISMSGNTGTQGVMLAYNRIWRSKKNASVKTYFRNTTGTACPKTTQYVKGDVYLLYYIVSDYQHVACGGSGGPLYTYTNYRLLSNGYRAIDVSYQVTTPGAYDFHFPKGVTLRSSGNINVDFMAVSRRTYANNTLSDFTVKGYAYSAEKFDSVPYQRASYSNPEIGFNPIVPAFMDKLNFFRDTILAYSTYYPDFSLAGGGDHIYAAGLMGSYGSRYVRLQNLEVSRKASDSFAIEYKTNFTGTAEKAGVAIGKEISTGFSSDNITYDHPLVSINNKGKGMFYIREYYRAARVSPIGSGVALKWGAMGKPISNGLYNNYYYNLEQPVATLDSTGNAAIIAWRDNKFIPGNTGENIFMRQLNKLDVLNYSPPVKKIKLVSNPYGATPANPAVLYGTSRQYSTLDVYSSYGSDPGTTPMMDILDNNFLGRVQATIYQHAGAVRRYNNLSLINRNFTVKTDSLPPAANVDMLLYFTSAEFNAIKASDNEIISPDYLVVLRQPNTSATAPAAYTPVAGEQIISPQSWDSLPGGFAMRIISTGLGNFFVQKLPVTGSCSGAVNTLISDVSGSTYEWQVNTGSSWNYLTNDATYSGVNNLTLQISNTSAAFNGYRYRCAIDGAKVSKTFLLQVANVWTGAVNNLWETAGNWSCGILPNATTDVVINAGAITVNSSTAACRSIKVAPGASVTVVPGANLAVMH